MNYTAIGITVDSFGVSDITSELFELPRSDTTLALTSTVRRQAAEYALKSQGQYNRILILSVLDGYPIIVDDFPQPQGRLSPVFVHSR